jgi:hypothetical protein
MDTRASRCAIWKLHATPSSEADINPNPQKGGYPVPHRVTFLNGPNRDFPKRRRHVMQRSAVPLACPPTDQNWRTVSAGVLLFDEPFTAARLLLIGPIVVGIVGLNLS